MTENRDVESVERTILQPAEAIFAFLAAPRRHHEIDGSGTVKEVKEGAPERLTLGAKFGMSMKLGIKYSMVSEVIEFEDYRRIAWQCEPPRVAGRPRGATPTQRWRGARWRGRARARAEGAP